MSRKKLVDGVLLDFTAEEETARDNQEAAAAAEEAAYGYKRERIVGTATTTGYTSLPEQLDQLYHDINAGKFGADAKTGNWFVGISSVKTSFPKP
tara:strand:+ start:757 stop:1041 length:285 start_codon:yes stop_codon:yes gene_type:complete